MAVHCFYDGYVGKQPVAGKEYCAEYWLKDLQESMERCTGHHDITEILLKTALNTIQSINHLSSRLKIKLQTQNSTKFCAMRNFLQQKINFCLSFLTKDLFKYINSLPNDKILNHSKLKAFAEDKWD